MPQQPELAIFSTEGCSYRLRENLKINRTQLFHRHLYNFHAIEEIVDFSFYAIAELIEAENIAVGRINRISNLEGVDAEIGNSFGTALL